MLKMKAENRISRTFRTLKEKRKKALVTFITAGDPDLATSRKIILELVRSGADIIELGIPFSDPMADGPTIQASSERAVKNGVTLKSVLALIKDVRTETDVPVVLFGYYNPIFRYGVKRFSKEAKAAGADGVLVVDLPLEESGELKDELDREGLDLIFLVTPTSDDKRIEKLNGKAAGFVYFISVTGITGARKDLSAKIPGYVKKIKRHTGLPVCVGFGISTPAQAKEVCRSADGAVVGSAIINIIARNKPGKKLLKEVGGFAAGLKQGIDG